MPQKIKNIEERRLFERFSARFPAKIKDTRQDFGSRILLRDASAEGARFLFNDKVLLNDNITVEVDLARKSQPLSLKGDVVWTKLRDDNSWDVGIKFSKTRLLKMSQLYELVTSTN